MSKQRLPNKEAREFDKLARKAGWRLVRHGSHLVYQHENEAVPQMTVHSSKASDHRAQKNNLARMRRLAREFAAA